MVDLMINREGREALRGVEEEVFDLLAHVLTSKQWAELLKAPLERAAAKGNRGLAQMLVGAGAEIGDALHKAIRSGHEDLVNDLLENGASVTAKDTSHDGFTPLHVAAQTGKAEMVQLLLVKGADKDAFDQDNYTPICLAVLVGHLAVTAALLTAGADVSLRCGDDKASVLHLAAQRGHVDIMRAAIACGADVNAVDTSQSTPLHDAALYCKVEVINVLLEAGANIDARDHEDRTPLNFSINQITNPKVLLALLKHGADANAQDECQQMPLYRAAAYAGTRGAAGVVDLLLRSGADETILNDEDKAAADAVAEYVDEEEQLAEDVARVRELWANAPADRIWRRRGYLVLCRAHLDGMRQIQDISSAQAGVARTTRSGAKMGRTKAIGCSGAVKASPEHERGGGDWTVAVAGLQEEGIFRMIMGYL